MLKEFERKHGGSSPTAILYDHTECVFWPKIYHDLTLPVQCNILPGGGGVLKMTILFITELDCMYSTSYGGSVNPSLSL